MFPFVFIVGSLSSLKVSIVKKKGDLSRNFVMLIFHVTSKLIDCFNHKFVCLRIAKNICMFCCVSKLYKPSECICNSYLVLLGIYKCFVG